MTDYKDKLVSALLEIQYADQMTRYERRNWFTYEAIALALRCGYKAGIRIDPQEPEWPVAFIELPTGQITYHLEQHGQPWDNHTTEEKQLRILRFVSEICCDR
jgi:hypothetical protein